MSYGKTSSGDFWACVDGSLSILTRVSKADAAEQTFKDYYYQSNCPYWGYYFVIRYLSPDCVMGTGTTPDFTASEISDLLADAQGIERFSRDVQPQ